MTPWKLLRTLIRYTDLLTFFDLEGTEKVRAALKTRGRNEHSTTFEGELQELIPRMLAVVGAGLPRELKPAFEREMALEFFPTFEEYLRKFDDALEAYSAPVWFERYERSQASYLEFGVSPPIGARVMPFNPDRYSNYRSYTIEHAENRSGEPERFFLKPGTDDPDLGWFIPKADWWRFVYVLPPKRAPLYT